MAKNKTKPTTRSVAEFIDSLEDETKRRDCYALVGMMQEVTGEIPVLWNGNMVGFGKVHYKYASGHEGDIFLTGFSPRAQNLTLYLTMHYDDHVALLLKLGTYKAGKSCLYLKKLADVDTAVLKKLITLGAQQAKDWYAKH